MTNMKTFVWKESATAALRQCTPPSLVSASLVFSERQPPVTALATTKDAVATALATTSDRFGDHATTSKRFGDHRFPLWQPPVTALPTISNCFANHQQRFRQPLSKTYLFEPRRREADGHHTRTTQTHDRESERRCEINPMGPGEEKDGGMGQRRTPPGGGGSSSRNNLRYKSSLVVGGGDGGVASTSQAPRPDRAPPPPPPQPPQPLSFPLRLHIPCGAARLPPQSGGSQYTVLLRRDWSPAPTPIPPWARGRSLLWGLSRRRSHGTVARGRHSKHIGRCASLRFELQGGRGGVRQPSVTTGWRRFGQRLGGGGGCGGYKTVGAAGGVGRMRLGPK